jgi:hypothetical protein
MMFLVTFEQLDDTVEATSKGVHSCDMSKEHVLNIGTFPPPVTVKEFGVSITSFEPETTLQGKLMNNEYWQFGIKVESTRCKSTL